MKSITNHNILNNIPIISISHKGLEAIKEVVKIAPQEAQWFHTVEPVIYKSSPNEIHLMLSEKLYIPTQNTSVAQVDTTSSMMMDFYRELQKDYQDQAVVNQKLQAMTCWCHSHHNMAPNPSAQDDTQFNSFVTMADDQGQKLWQIMLIFNKKNNFYSRVFDPLTRTIHEGVPIHVINDYDFTYIHQAAKIKFKKPLPKPKFLNFPTDSLFPKNHFSFENQKEIPHIPDWDINLEIAQDIIDNLYSSHKKDISKAKAKINSSKLHSFLDEFSNALSTQEYTWLFYLLNSNYNKIIKTYDIFAKQENPLEETFLKNEIQKMNIFFLDYFANTKDSLEAFTNSLAIVIYFIDAPSKQDLIKLVEYEGTF